MATTWDSNRKTSTIALSGGNLVATSSGLGVVAATRSMTGNTYFEVTATTLTGTLAIGFLNPSYNTASASILGTDNNGLAYKSSGAVVLNNVTLTTLATYAAGNVIGVAVDLANRLVWFRVGAGNWNNNAGFSPVTGVGGIDFSTIASTPLLPAAGASATGAVLTAAFTTFANTAPTGFVSIDGGTVAATDRTALANEQAKAVTLSVGACVTHFKTPAFGWYGHMNAGIAPASNAPVPVAAVLAGGVVGTAYSETISAAGGVSPYNLALDSGSLPTGATLNSSTGVISGALSAAGTFGFNIKATDAVGATGITTFSITVASPGGGASNYGYVS